MVWKIYAYAYTLKVYSYIFICIFVYILGLSWFIKAQTIQIWVYPWCYRVPAAGFENILYSYMWRDKKITHLFLLVSLFANRWCTSKWRIADIFRLAFIYIYPMRKSWSWSHGVVQVYFNMRRILYLDDVIVTNLYTRVQMIQRRKFWCKFV